VVLLVRIHGDEFKAERVVSENPTPNTADANAGEVGIDNSVAEGVADGRRENGSSSGEQPESRVQNDAEQTSSGMPESQEAARGENASSEGASRLQDESQSIEVVPFRPSRSIQERCRTQPVPTADSCKEVGTFLEEMSRELRDAPWAASTELRLRAVVAARGDGTQIRALECKTSLCAIETLSPGDQHLAILGQAEQEAAGIVDDGDFVLAWEEDPTHGRVTITVRIFTIRLQ
jgi:hypothetical protein